MLLIGLSGGTPEERVEIADRLVASGKGRLVAYAQASPAADYVNPRLRNLRHALEGMDTMPALGGVVIVHCLSEVEANELRSRGAAIWHVYSKPSALVPIRLGDPIVCDGEQGFRHVRSPLEALSELMLSRLATATPAHA